MDYEQFKEQIRTAMIDRHPGSDVRSESIRKENGLVLDALIMQTDPTRSVTPTLYIRNYYEEYQQGLSFEACLERMEQDYNRHSPLDLSPELIIGFQKDFMRARPQIIYRLVSLDKNSELLDDVPHRIFHDLAVVYYLMMFIDEKTERVVMTIDPAEGTSHYSGASIMIHNENMKSWNVTEDDLFRAACENTPALLPSSFENIHDIINEMYRDLKVPVPDNEEFIPGSSGDGTWPMWVLSNIIRLYGASAMLYEDELNRISNRIGSPDFYILPSSIHELIIIPNDGNLKLDVSDLKSMVRTINKEEVSVREQLSDNIYYYNNRKKELCQL